MKQGGERLEVLRLEKEYGLGHEELNFSFKALTALLLLQEKYSELI